MANTLTNLIPSLVEGFDIVSREMTGLIPSVNRDARADRIAKNQTLYSWAAPAATIQDITPGNVSPQAGDKALTNKSIVISNYKMTDFYFTAEEEYALNGSYGNIVTDMIEQGIRTITNQIETDVFTAAYIGASRAAGTAGTTPFASDIGASAQIRKVLDQNGAPHGNRSLVIDTSSGAALRTLQQLTRVNEAGTSMGLRDGELLNLNGFSVKESNAILPVTKGTGASYVINGAHAAGATSVTVKTGTGTILAGDIVSINSVNYVVASGVAAPGTIIIGAPGLLAAATDGTSVTLANSPARNIALSKNAILLATRLPASPSGGDSADDRYTMTDPRSGISLEVSMYKQYKQVRFEIAAAWGVSVIKPEHLAVLMG